MKCPYCAEEIKDEALVCQFCLRDLVVFRPIFDRLSKIEKTTQSVHTDMEGLSSIGGVRLIAATIAVSLSISLSFVFYWISWQGFAGSEYDWLWQSLSIASPLLAAFWLGLSSPELSTTYLWLAGSFAGAGGFIQMFLLFQNQQGAASSPPPHLLLSFVAYLASGTFLFPTGSGVGRRIIRGRSYQHFIGSAEKADQRVGTVGTEVAYLNAILGFLGPLLVAWIQRKGH